MRVLLPALLALVLLVSQVHAENDYAGLSMPEYGYITPSQVTSYIEAKVENRGYYRVFVALPKGWELDLTEYSVKSYAVREFGLWRVYGEELAESGRVYRYRGSFQKSAIVVKTPEGTYTGWYLKPNEGLIIKVKTKPISGDGVVDPLKIEKLYPGVKVLRWYQEFTVTLPQATYGWVRAPWVVRGASLVEAYPSPYGEEHKTVITDKSFFGAEGLRYEYLEAEVDVPAWNEWMPLRNSLAYALVWRPIMNFTTDFVEPGSREYVRPVWDTQKHRTGVIRYAYEWRRDTRVRGIELFRDDFDDIPSWMELF
ncbi:MAG: hypothetical protein GXO66_07190 [Euryarchaeota archaeon]|nr:hypothetical protein [Euryarchaeota archaeon]